MRAYHVTALLAALIIELGMKQFLLPPKPADADVLTASMDVLKMQREINMKTLHQQKTADKAFVFIGDE